MKKNMGTFDAMLKIMFGLFGFGWGVSRMTRYPKEGFPVMVTMLSAWKVAEGITRWSPILEAMNVSTVEKFNFKKNNTSKQDNQHVEIKSEV